MTVVMVCFHIRLHVQVVCMLPIIKSTTLYICVIRNKGSNNLIVTSYVYVTSFSKLIQATHIQLYPFDYGHLIAGQA